MRARRYPSDLTDQEWQILGPMLPPPACRTPRGGRPELHDRRDVVNAIRYVVSTGIQWRALPCDFPPWSTVYKSFAKWSHAGAWEEIQDRLRTMIRTKMGRCPNPVTVIIDSQSVKGSDTVGALTRGYDAGKCINGRKRHVITDTRGLPVAVLVTPANIQDRDAAKLLFERLHEYQPQVVLSWGDSAYGGELEKWAKDECGLTVVISRRPPGAKGFVLIPRRWVVERTNAWIMKSRRNCRDYERRPDHSEAHITLALLAIMLRRLARGAITPERYPSAAVLAAGA